MSRWAFFALVCALSGAALGQQYRWVDEKGRVQYSDTPPPPTAKGILKKDLKGGSAQPPQTPTELARLQKEFPVTLYTSPICKGPCANSRDLLNQRGVPFKEVQVVDAAGSEELLKVSGSDQVPVLVVGRSVQNGFSRGEFNELLDSAGYPAAGVFPARGQAAPALPEGYSLPQNGGTKPAALPVEPEPSPKRGPYSPNFGPGEPEKPGPYAPRFSQ